MDERQYKRTVRMFTIMWFILLALLLYVLFRTPTTEVHNYIGKQGDKGETGLQGLQGVKGEPGEVTTVTRLLEKETVVEKHIPVKGDTGEKGEKGKPGEAGATGERGEPGRTPELRANPESGDIEWRLEGDSFWQLLLPKCELTTERCEE